MESDRAGHMEDVPLGELGEGRKDTGTSVGSGGTPDGRGAKRPSDIDVEASSGNRNGSIGADTAPQNAQAGVRNIEAIATTWTAWGLVIAYASLFLTAFTVSLEGQVVQSLSVFATSSFQAHSLISTVYVVQGVVNAVIKPPMAKVADVFGRLEAFSFSVLLYIIGYVQMAASHNVETYAAAQIFYSAGNTGLQVLQQVFIADTSDLLNRALWSSLPDIPFLITVWVGPLVGDDLLRTTSWRWGYGMWCVLLPLTFVPLALTLSVNNRKAKRLGLTTEPQLRRMGFMQASQYLWVELDIGGIVLLSAAFALILIPLTIAPKQSNGWSSGDIIAMIVAGAVCLIAFLAWEAVTKLVPYPLVPPYLFKTGTFSAGCGVGFFYFMAFYLSVQPYFYSYLLVVQHVSIPAASHITQTFSFTSTVASIAVSFLIKYTKFYKPYVVAGVCIYILGLGLMIKYRSEGVSTGALVGTQIAVGIGGGMLNVSAQLGVQASTDHRHVAVATAVYLTCVELGGAVGSAVSGAVWGRNIPRKLALYLPASAAGRASDIYNDITVATSYAAGTPERAAIDRAYNETMRILLIIAVGVAVPLLFFSAMMSSYRLDELKQNVKGRVVGDAVRDGQGVEAVREEEMGRRR
ncbi:hypothetical protein JHW43_003720 [Diplocarpon mali]|nr:hypothetical protein JHW43_003720 [Diplocarpon mali]